MCGIAGIFHYRNQTQPVDRALLTRMTRLLAHRGPDDESFYFGAGIGLGHRRLSVVDTTAVARQPMSSPDGTIWITYNGEAYNHTDLRRRLEPRGYTFRSQSDAETMLYHLHHGGPHALTDVVGIFSLAFWDARHRRLILARDPLGMKQLFFHDDGNSLYFASEMKALLAHPGIAREADYEAFNQFAHFQTTLFDRTFFSSIRQVRSAEYLEVRNTGVHARRYWHLDGTTTRDGHEQDQVDELRTLLEEVVTDQLQSDVPVGAFFSGGIDSSAIAAFARRGGRSLRCFGVHFDHPDVVDERPFQEASAAAIGVDLELTTVGPAALPDDLPRLMYYQDQPAIGTALLPMYYVSQLAAKHVKVCLGGQGADELFAGYGRYALAHPLQQVVGAISHRTQRQVHKASGADGTRAGDLFKQLRSLRNVRRLLRSGTRLTAEARYFDNLAVVPERLWRQLGVTSTWMSRDKAEATFRDTLAASPARDVGDKFLHWDMQTYLTGLFQQDDRMSMANGLESRAPFADPRLVRFAFHTPFRLKLRAGSSKWILRQCLTDVLPPGLLARRKTGFDNPVQSWLRGPHLGFVRETLLSSSARSRGLWDTQAVAHFIERKDHRFWFDVVWKLLSIELWAQIFVDRSIDVAPEEEVAYALARHRAGGL